MTRDEVKIDIEHMLDWFGVHNIERRGHEIWYSCPFAGHKTGDKKQSASFKEKYPERAGWGWVFNCFGCGERGDVIDFLVRHENLDEGKTVSPRRKAKEWLRGQYGTGWVDPGNTLAAEIDKLLADGARKTKREVQQAVPESVLEDMAVEWQAVFDAACAGDEVPEALTYMLARGFTPETLTAWEIGYDQISDRIAIPYRDAKGQLVGFKGRAYWPNAKAKYKVLGNVEGREDRYTFDAVKVGKLVFGHWKVAAGGGKVPLCEGEFNTMAMHQFGFERALGISGQFLSEDQARQILSVADEVVLIFDELDKALRAADMLERAVPVWIVPERENDPADSTQEEVTAWVNSAQLPFKLVDLFSQ